MAGCAAVLSLQADALAVLNQMTLHGLQLQRLDCRDLHHCLYTACGPACSHITRLPTAIQHHVLSVFPVHLQSCPA